MRPAQAIRAARDWWRWPGMSIATLLMAACVLGVGISIVISGSWRSGASLVISALAVTVAITGAGFSRALAFENRELSMGNLALMRENAELKGRVAALETEERRSS